MLCMLLLTLRIDKEVIQVGRKEFIKHVHEKVINIMLECRWSIGKAERHDLVVEASISCSERCKMLGIRVNSNLMESLADINFGHNLSLQELREDLVN